MAKFTDELNELVANGVISPEIADNIRGYYNKPEKAEAGKSSLLVITFGIIGALLVGMGVVLIIAHNWDDLSTSSKLIIGLSPLFVSQALAGYIVVRSISSQAWREAVGVLIIFSVATSIAILGQVYNIHSSFSNFLLAWAALTLPVFYVLQSRIASLLYWMVITWYAVDVGFGIFTKTYMPVYYWPLALAAVPFYIHLVRKTPMANSVSFHNWIIGGSITIVLGLSKFDQGEDLLIPAYITLFSVFLLIGQLPVFANRRLMNNAWLIGGSAGTIFLLLFLTFEWADLSGKSSDWWLSMPMAIWAVLFFAASALLYIVGKKNGFRNVLSKSYTFIIFLGLLLIGLSNPLIARGLTNVLLLALGIYTIREGAIANKLWKMNYGVMIVSLLIICRFFDTDMSFVIRGLLFVMIGVGFFLTNYYMAKRRRAQA